MQYNVIEYNAMRLILQNDTGFARSLSHLE